MNNKINQRDKSLLLIVLGIVIVALAYVLGFSKLQTKTEVLNNENNNLASSISRLEELKANQGFYEDEIARFETENAEMKNVYPSMILNADEILFARKIEDVYSMTISSLAMSQPENIVVEYPTASLMDVNGGTSAGSENPNGVYLYAHKLAVSFEGDYTDVKRVLKYLVTDKQPKSVESVSLNYNDSTGLLAGSLSTTLYSLTGTDVEYSRPDFSGISTGTDDIFGSFSNASKVNDIENDENSEDNVE